MNETQFPHLLPTDMPMSVSNLKSDFFGKNRSSGLNDESFDPGGESGGSKLHLSSHLPERYTVKTNGSDRVLICLEAPNISVHIERGLSISGSVARKSPNGTIFLDGVAQCEPFLDHEHQIYNLDHHEGCVRTFTLASCEQTLVMYMKGLDLQAREWNIFANEPDLDTVLALWILLNHARIGKQDATQRRTLFALVRYEGVIDALGLELKELSALPPELMRRIQRVIDHLRSEELALKKEDRWAQTDYLTYTAAILHKIDQIFYKPSDFEDFQGIEELARIDLSEQRIAVVVAADMGIYEIEPHLNKIYGNRVGVVFLRKGANTYTVRQMDLFMPITLEEIYERLNFFDPAVKCRTKTNKWGGANDIGGSPRESGTRLSPAEIATTCRDAVRKLSLLQKASRFGSTSALVGFIALCAYLVKLHWLPMQWLKGLDLPAFLVRPDFGFALMVWLASSVSLLLLAYCQPWQYGWIGSSGKKWWWLLPLTLTAAIGGGIWMPPDLHRIQDWRQIVVIGLVAMPLASEILFRSLVHGMLAQRSRIQKEDSRWFVSWPALGSSVLYTVYLLFLIVVSYPDFQTMPAWKMGLHALCAITFGLTLSMVRERSHSIFPPILFHLLAAAGALGATLFLNAV